MQAHSAGETAGAAAAGFTAETQAGRFPRLIKTRYCWCIDTNITTAVIDNITYYWRIDSKGNGHLTEGDVWSFTTAQAPTPASLVTGE